MLLQPTLQHFFFAMNFVFGINSSATASKKYSGKDGPRIEFGSFASSDLWGIKDPEIMEPNVFDLRVAGHDETME